MQCPEGAEQKLQTRVLVGGARSEPVLAGTVRNTNRALRLRKSWTKSNLGEPVVVGGARL